MGIESWSTSAGSNNQAPPNGWPGGMLPSQVEPTARQMMASLAVWYQAAQWINYNATITYVSATQFTVTGNQTGIYQVNRRVQATDGSTSVYGTISASVFSTLTTVTVVWDSGVLQTGVTIVYVGIISVTNTSIPAASIGRFNDGTAAAPSISFQSDTTLGLYKAGTDILGLTTAGAQRITVNASGNTTLNAPSVGNALTVNQFSSTPGILVSGSGSTVSVVDNGASQARVDVVATSAKTTLNFTANITTTPAAIQMLGADVIGISTGRNITVSAPSSGDTLTVNALAGGNVLRATDGTAISEWLSNGAGGVFFGTISSHQLQIGTAGATRITLSNAGNVTIGAPSSGQTVNITGAASAYGAQIIGSASSGASLGLSVHAGTTSADTAFDVTNQAGTTDYFTVRGDGLAKAIDQGNTLQDIGWRDMPQNVMGAGTYTFALSDRGKQIYNNFGAVTFTIPANASIAFPIGTVIEIINESGSNNTINITTDTLAWLQGGSASTGSRTVATSSTVVLQKVQSTRWVITGFGIS